MNDDRLDGSVTIVTGGARGQGATEARRIVAAGGQVVVADVLEDEGRSVADELGAIFMRLDVSSRAGWESVVGDTVARFGRLDGLVNNAGIFSGTPMVDTDEELFRRIFEVNQLGVFLGMKSVVGPMTQTGGGSIVNVSSVAGLKGFPAFAYTATKHAVTGMTRTAARELGSAGIRVNSVHPGVIDTPMLPPGRGEDLGTASALGRVGTADEVASTVVFLLSPASAYVSGAQLTVDGGLIA